MSKLISMLKTEKLDVLFLQEATQKVIADIQSRLPQYRIVQTPKCTSVIVINAVTFSKQIKNKTFDEENRKFCINENEINSRQQWQARETLSLEDMKRLNVNDKTVVQMVGDYIFICSHLTGNLEQTVQLKHMLCKLFKSYRTKNIVVGVNSNYEMIKDLDKSLKQTSGKKDRRIKFQVHEKNRLFYECFHQFPGASIPVLEKDDYFTVRKKRTCLQPQIYKSDQEDYEIKDYIISTSWQDNSKVRFINDRTLKVLIPHEDHPYDHLFLYTEVQRKNRQIIEGKMSQSLNQIFESKVKVLNGEAPPVDISISDIKVDEKKSEAGERISKMKQQPKEQNINGKTNASGVRVMAPPPQPPSFHYKKKKSSWLGCIC